MAKGGFYAVKVGRVPGVYTSWDECKAQVNGFSDAMYQKFKTEDEANAFVGVVEAAAEEPAASSEPEAVVEEDDYYDESYYKDMEELMAEPDDEPVPRKGNFYAVRVGKTPGVYETWAECKAQVDGVAGAKYKKFDNDLDAKRFVDGMDVEKKPAASKVVAKSSSVPLPDGPYAFVDGSFNPDTGVYGYGGFVNVLGRKYPIYGSDCDPEMASMRNVAGEISGAMAAVKKAESLHIRDLTILYDYRGIEEWANGGWKANKQGTRDYAEFMDADNRLVEVKFQKVPAHTGIEGNEMADVMAKNAVGIRLTGPQQKLLDKALSCGKRDGLPGVGASDGADFGFDFE